MTNTKRQRVYRYWAVIERTDVGGWRRTIFKTEAAARAFETAPGASVEVAEFPCYRERGALYPVRQTMATWR